MGWHILHYGNGYRSEYLCFHRHDQREHSYAQCQLFGVVKSPFYCRVPVRRTAKKAIEFFKSSLLSSIITPFTETVILHFDAVDSDQECPPGWTVPSKPEGRVEHNWFLHFAGLPVSEAGNKSLISSPSSSLSSYRFAREAINRVRENAI